MQYMLLIYSPPETTYTAPDAGAEYSAEAAAKHAEWGQYTEALRASGAFVGGDALNPATDATTVRVRGERVVTDGPFAETKEWLVGYYLIDVEDLDAAIGWAEKMPNITYGSVEVRPVWDYAASMA